MWTLPAIISAVNGGPDAKSCQVTSYFLPLSAPASASFSSSKPSSRMSVPAVTVLMVFDW